jgi:hypothetical protein
MTRRDGEVSYGGILDFGDIPSNQLLGTAGRKRQVFHELQIYFFREIKTLLR